MLPFDFEKHEPGDKIVKMGLTHPTIDSDYYTWREQMSDFDNKFIEKMMKENNSHGIAMYFWQRSRESLRMKAYGKTI